MRIAILKKDALYWDYIEVEYNKRFKNQKVGAGNKPARMAVDTLIIKYMLGSGVEKRVVPQQRPFPRPVTTQN